ncbi:hypothetical protein [Zunongwangia sp. HGR-M22]|uniref:hypothetical protein n=1 Tax=Zunongwangia sp. HGR-M22 TaxID=3015168 RepID=UPI0022DCEF2A|nr:hypothetical protein [Zunongwangia sp. HGR-M22]WBL25085.1 hypothetical protein PBT91_14425 [Zunongwangia sp. HGR-M22]
MANKFQLEVYTLNIRKKYSEDVLGFYNTFGDENESMISFFKDFVKFNDRLNVDEEQQRSFKILKEPMTISGETGVFSGVVQSGEYGTGSSIVDQVSEKEVYKKKKTDLEIKPFYFLIWFPLNGRKAFLILQRTGIYGINTIFSLRFKDFIDSKKLDLKIDYKVFTSTELARKTFEKGKIKEFILTRNNLPSDIVDKMMDNVDGQLYIPKIKNVEIRIKAADAFFPETKFDNFMSNNNTKFFETPAFKELGMDGSHRKKIRVKIGDKNRTIDISESFALRPYVDIGRDLRFDVETGHPLFTSIDEIAKEFVEDIRKEVF